MTAFEWAERVPAGYGANAAGLGTGSIKAGDAFCGVTIGPDPAPPGAGKEAIKKTGKLKAKLTFTFTPNGGAASAITRTI